MTSLLKAPLARGTYRIAVTNRDGLLIEIVGDITHERRSAAELADGLRRTWGRLRSIRPCDPKARFGLHIESRPSGAEPVPYYAHEGMTWDQLADTVSRKLLHVQSVATAYAKFTPVERLGARIFGRAPGRARGVVAVEFALLLVAILLPTIAGCTAVDTAIRDRWPGVSLLEVVGDAVVFHADRVAAKKNPPPPAI